MAKQVIDKKLKKDIFEDEIGANAHSILGAFRQQALREGWTASEAEKVLDEAKDGDYDHLIQTLMMHIE